MTIVYTSKTGFTREYAQMLGRAAGLPVCALDEATGKVGPGSDILYLGWLMAGHISGIDHAVKRFHVRAACGVGMTPPGDKVLQDLARSNYVPNAPHLLPSGRLGPEKGGVAPAPDGRDGHQGAAAVPPAEAGADPSGTAAAGSAAPRGQLRGLPESDAPAGVAEKAGGLTGCGMEGEEGARWENGT